MPVKDYKAYYAANRERFHQYHQESYQRNKKKTRLASNHRRREKLRLMVNALKDNPCMDCQQRFNPICMEYDHRDPSTKRKSISYMVAQCYNRTEILKEIKNAI